MSTIAESSANHHLELQPGLDRLGKIEEQFMVGHSASSVTPLLREDVETSTHTSCNRARRSPSPSLSRTAPRTTSSSPRATTPPATSRRRPTMSRTSTAAAPARSSRSRVSGTASPSPTSNRRGGGCDEDVCYTAQMDMLHSKLSPVLRKSKRIRKKQNGRILESGLGRKTSCFVGCVAVQHIDKKYKHLPDRQPSVMTVVLLLLVTS